MNPSSRADSRLRWQARLDAQRASGLTIAQFCQQHHYSLAEVAWVLGATRPLILRRGRWLQNGLAIGSQVMNEVARYCSSQ
jgi:hypothetical protein